MATRTSIYLRGEIETEITMRAKRRLGEDGEIQVGQVILRHLNALFAGYKQCRAVVADQFTYDELRYLCYVIDTAGWDEDQYEANQVLSEYAYMYYVDARDKASAISAAQMEQETKDDADWLYWMKVDAEKLGKKIDDQHPFDTLALADGILTVLMSDKRDRELARLFKGVRRPA